MTRRSGVWLWSALAACGGPHNEGVTTGVVLAGSAASDNGTTDLTATTLGGVMTSTDGDLEQPTSEATGSGVCGDGIQGDSEACDDGFVNNQIYNDCDPLCKETWCGDKIIQLDEDCDWGDTANIHNPLYNGCTEECKRGPHCGDEMVQMPEEECEPGDSPDGATCGPDCHYFTRTLFLASQPTTGAMGGLTGAMGADWHCQELADGAGISGTFMAWLVVDGQDLEGRFEAIGDFADPLHIRTPDNVPLAESIKELVSKGPDHAVATTEAKVQGGFVRIYKKQVWTNISSDGLPVGGDCGDWKQADGTTARVGHSGFADEESKAHQDWVGLRRWTDTGFSRSCDDPDIHTYCLQVSE